MQVGVCQGNRVSGNAIGFHLIRLIVDYSICLGVPDNEGPSLANEWPKKR